MISGLLALVCWIVFARAYRREPRRLRVAALFDLACWLTLSGLAELTVTILPFLVPLLGIVIVLLPFLAVVLAVFLVANGLTMIRKEGRSLAHALSLLAGLALIALPIVAVLLVASRSWILIIVAGCMFVVSTYLGVVFTIFVTFAVMCLRRTPRPDPIAVIVLGSGLIGGHVPPLLRHRLDRGREAYELARVRNHELIMVPSGGQGDDEPRSEASAMAEYLVENGVPAPIVRAEDRARTTYENLALSKKIIAEAGLLGWSLVVTSNYHVPRTALLAAQVGLDADVAGAPTARYYLPSAFLREFIAVMRMHVWAHLGLLVPAVLGPAALVTFFR